MSEEAERCYICLGSAEEMPPMPGSSDTKGLVQVCPCSLRAHKRCLTDYAFDFEFKRLQNEDGMTNAVNSNPPGSYRFGAPIGKINGGRYTLIKSNVKCPQCSSPLLVFMKPSKLLSLHGLISSGLSDLVKTGSLAIAGSVGAVTVSVATMGIFVSTGLNMFSAVAPDSVLTKLLDFKSKSIDKAMRNEEVNFRHLGLLAGFPFFLFGLRADNVFMDLLSTIYPTMFFKGQLTDASQLSGPKLFLLLSQPLKRIYNLIYSMTLNRIYYRWTTIVKPIFMADRVSLKELQEIEEENVVLQEIWDKEYQEQQKLKPSFFKKMLRKLFYSSPQEKEIMRKRKSREFKSIFTRDYGLAFQKKSILIKILTTVLWPYLGSLVGKFILKIPEVNGFCNRFTSTPDESTYLANLLGSLLLVVGKDLFNLLVAYEEVRQLSFIGLILHNDSNKNGEGNQDVQKEKEEEEEEDFDEERVNREVVGPGDGRYAHIHRNSVVISIKGVIHEFENPLLEGFHFDLEDEDSELDAEINFDRTGPLSEAQRREVEDFRVVFRLKQAGNEAARRIYSLRLLPRAPSLPEELSFCYRLSLAFYIIGNLRLDQANRLPFSVYKDTLEHRNSGVQGHVLGIDDSDDEDE